MSINIYHYGLVNDEKIVNILKDRSLKPINITRDPVALSFYENRKPGMSPDEYFEFIYDKLYKPILRKLYKNYGIYMTCVDLFGITNLKLRFIIPYKRLKGDTIIQVGGNIKLVKSEQDIIDVCKNFQNQEKVKRLWNSYKFKFKALPQIINFEDSIPVSKNDLEIYNG